MLLEVPAKSSSSSGNNMREPNSKKRRRWYNAESEIFSQKIILCASFIPIKCAPLKHLVISVHLRSFTTVLVRFYRKNTGLPKLYSGYSICTH